MRPAGVVVLSAACLTALAACSAATKADVGPTALPTTKVTTAAASPTASAAPTAVATSSAAANGAKDLSDPKLGIVFVDVPQLTGDEADVYNSLARYEREYWRTLTTNKTGAGAAEAFGTDAAKALTKIAADNAKNKSDIGGTFRATIDDVAVADNGGNATASVCDNFDDATFQDPGGTYTPQQAGFERRLKRVTVVPGVADGTWRIYKIDTEGSC